MSLHRSLRSFVLALTTLAVPAAAQFGPVTATPYGPSCGPTLSADVSQTGNTHRIAFTVSQAAPNSVVILWIGTDEYDVLFPDFGCTVLTSAVFIQNHRTDPTGSYVWARSLGDWFGTAYVQFANVTLSPMGDLQIATTNGIRVDGQ
jgi:hypothetical protein